MTDQHIKILLDDWAVWARKPVENLGYPRRNTIKRMMIYGHGASHQCIYYGPDIDDLPPYVKLAERILQHLRDISEPAYMAVRLSHLERASDYRLARRLRMSRQQFRAERRYGYGILGRMVKH